MQEDMGKALPEDLGSFPSTRVVAYGHLQLWFQGIQCPLLAFRDTSMHSVHRHTCRENVKLFDC